jgi:flagellar biosynthesis/type III secretory pathway protein FliH
MSQTKEVEYTIREIADELSSQSVNLAWEFERILNSLYDSAYQDGYDDGHDAGLSDANDH